ncbi:glycerate kinase [Agromyces soli]
MRPDPAAPAPAKRVVFAPDSFKGTVDARDAAAALARGWRSARPHDELLLRPMADGGEGTLDAFEAAVPGARRVPVTVTGPDDLPVEASWLALPDGTAVVELAATSGITLLDPLRPHDAHTRGFGEAIAAALDAGATRLLLGLGGSSSSDGGVGALTALGARFTDASGRPIPSGNRGLGELARVDLGGLRRLPPRGAVVLGDVTNPLLGAAGAAAVFGPQKGAAPGDVARLEAGLVRLVEVLGEADTASTGFARSGGAGGRAGGLAAVPGAGAAGGTGFGLLVWGADMGAGSRLVAEAIGLADALAAADLVVTGEGRYDGQSAAGKAPSEVARLARDAGVPVALVAGAILAEPRGFEASVSLVELAGDPASAMADGVAWLERAGAHLTALAS